MSEPREPAEQPGEDPRADWGPPSGSPAGQPPHGEPPPPHPPYQPYPGQPGPGQPWPHPYTTPGQRSGLAPGAAVAIGATAGVIAFGFVAGLLNALLDAVAPQLQLLGGLPVLAVIAGVVWRPTRWYAVGILIGLAVLLIVFAGICVALIALIAGSYG